MPNVLRCLCLLLLVCLSPLAQAERLRLVSDEWAPYLYQVNGRPAGIDYEVTTEVFRRLGVEVDWEFMPWKRSLAMVEQGLADGVMDIFEIDARKPFMVFPEEPMSTVEFVLFQATDRPHAIKRLEDLAGLTVGTSPGYFYGKPFNDSPLFRREAAPTHEANFGKLLLGRVDVLVTDRRVGRHLIQQLALAGKVQPLALVIDRQPQYLGLARKPGRERLAAEFSKALRQFKKEPAFAAIQARYENGIDEFPAAVEQQDRSTAR